MGCCNSCDTGGSCEGCGGACGGKCDGRCGKNPADVHSHSHDEHYDGDGHDHGEVYDAVMGGPMTQEIKRNTSLWRDGELLFIRYQNPAKKGSIVVSVPFAPVMMFCQNLAMVYGKPGTRPNTVMGYAPIIALLTSQLAAKKIADDANPNPNPNVSTSPSGSRAVDAGDRGPAILDSLLKMLPGLTSMVGVYYDNDEQRDELSEVATVLMGDDEMGLSCGPASSIRNTPACRHYHGMRGEDDMRGEAIDMGGCGCGTGVGGGCGCGVPCDGIQPNAPYMSEYHVTKRNSAFAPRRVQRANWDWNQVQRVNTTAQNHFGKVSHMDASAAPVQVSGYHDGYEHEDGFLEEQVPCAKGGTCGKSCCGSH